MIRNDQWQYKTFDEVSEDVDKSGPDDGETFDYIEIGSINNTTKQIEEVRRISAEEASSRASRRLKTGDVLISRTRPKLNGVAIVPEKYNNSIGTSGFYVVRSDHLLPKFTYYYAQTNEFIRDMSELATGSSYPSVNLSKIREYEIPVLDKESQRQIVSEIEKLLTKLESGVNELESVKRNMKKYRASILKSAFTGRLTEKWRMETEGNVKSPIESLDLLTEDLMEAKKRNDDNNIPESWKWVSIGDIFDVSIGSTPSRSKDRYWGGEIPWVSSGEVQFCRIKETEELITKEGLDNSSTTVHKPGTVLLAIIGQGKTRGQAAILDVAAAHNQNTAAIEVVETNIPPEFVYYYLMSSYERTRAIGSGNQQKALNKKRVQKMLLPLPPIEEQHEIVRILDERFSIIDEVEDEIDNGLTRATSLRQTILKQAMSGNLMDSTEMTVDEYADEQNDENTGNRGSQVTLSESVNEVN